MKRPARPATAQRGFTLIEILVVLVIFSILAVLGYGTLNNVLKQQAGIEAALERIALQQKAYMRLRNDLLNARMRPVRDEFGDQQAALFGGTDAGLEFTRGGWRNPVNAPRATLERVRYVLAGEKLQRASWRVLDRAQDSAPLETTLLDGVQEMRWRFLDAQLEWVDTWPDSRAQIATTADAPLPLAVELTLDTRELGEMRFLFRIGRDAKAEDATQAGSFRGGNNGNGTEGEPPPEPDPDPAEEE